jgi:poly-gamma-glutamate synthesis protein (capsule biosynthesis protein)
MTGRHVRKAPFPFWVLLVLIALVGVGMMTASAMAGRDATGADPAPGADRPSAAGPTTVTPPTGATGPTPSPSPTPSPEPKGSLLIHGTGDVSLDPVYLPVFGTQGYRWAWSGLDGLFREDDLTVINHECPSTDIVDPVPKQFNFRCDPDALPAAERAGVDVGNLANNHGYDQGPRGLLDSIRNLRAAGIAPVGAGRNELAAERPAVFDLNGWKVAVVGFGEVLDPLDQTAGPDKPGTATGHSLRLKLRAIRDADRVADLVIVTIHWGVELDTQPRDYQVREGHRMIDAGADVIFGHHSHRLQPMSRYHGRPIFWGLGNFVWPAFSVEGSTTAVAEVTVTPKGWIRGRLLPARIVSDGHPVLT